MALAFGRSSRNSSPYRAYRPSSLNGSLPGLSPSMTVSSSSISRKRSITPTRPGARSSSPVPPGSQQRNKPMLSPAIYSPRDRPPRDKENVSVTVRFRPLSQREIQKGDEVAWYADGDSIVRNEYSPSTMYAFDKVFGPATTTRGVYDVAAKHVVQGAMEGLNGTVFAYGVTSSGKTHTMHGDQKSPGIIPLAIKDVFSIIQDTPGREFLLRVSYLEIYNEVINDLLDPIGQNLRIREDCQGTYVEGLKEEVILSPAHALSLIAAGEEHRHVGSNNFNLFSSRSHTIFTLTVESSSRAENDNDEVALSQLNLIDLAGSESSKTETTGLRRKEGSYINKSLLTLGTVISKLSDGKASHVPYRDSKLTRLLQSSLSGHGRVSLICTITPASSNAEETHNTLKFAHRAKRIEIHAAPNRILDEKSLIKKYQKEIAILKAELDQVRRGVVDSSLPFGTSEEDLIALRQQLEAGQVKMQSRLEEEEQAKAALMGRIQRLTKLILVSTKTTIPKIISETPTHRRRHSFGEEELSYLPERANLLGLTDDEDSGSVVNDIEASVDSKGGISSIDDLNKDDKKTKRRSMLGWFKLKKNESLSGGSALSFDTDNSPTASTASAASNGAQFDSALECKGGRWKSSAGRRVSESTPAVDSFPESTMAGELFSATTRGRRPPPTGETMMDQMDLLREQSKMLAGEMALCTSSFKRLSEQVAVNPDDLQLQAQLRKMKDEIQEKKRQIRILEQRIIGVGEAALNNASPLEMSQTVSKLMSQLNEKEFELEIKTADNRILQEQLQEKIAENKDLQATIAVYKQQQGSCKGRNSGEPQHSGGETSADNESLSSKASSKSCLPDSSLQCQILTQAAEIEMLKQERVQLIEEKEGLNIQSQKLAEEASYAKELASAAAVELKNLAEEVTKLSFQNTKLSNDLATTREFMFNRAAMRPIAGKGLLKPRNRNEGHANADHFKLGRNDKPLASRLSDTGNDLHDDINSWKLDPDDLKRELYARKEKEAGLEATLAEKELVESDLRKKLEEAKKREADLESDLAGMWVLVAQLKKEQGSANELARIDSNDSSQNNSSEKNNENYNRFQGHGLETKDCREQEKAAEDVRAALEECHRKVAEQEGLISQLKGEQLDDLNLSALEDLQKLHVEALTKLCQAKARAQERCLKEQEVSMDHQDDERGSHICKVCFEAPTAAVLLPCRHFCLCKPCAIACTECPLCRSGIADRIITYTS